MDAKQTALENAMRKIEKDFGKGAIMRLGDVADKMNLEVISSGSLAVDLAVGVGGYPRGRVIEIYGPESSGKTTLALHAIASAQKSGGIAAFIDAEHALDPVYARHLGVDTNELLISQPDNGEQAFDGGEGSSAAARRGVVSLTQPAWSAEIEGEMGDSEVSAFGPRLMSRPCAN